MIARARGVLPEKGRGIPPIRMRRLGGILVGLVLLTTGCATGRIVGDMYRDSVHGFQVRLPPSPWHPMSLEGAAVAFASPALEAGMAFRADCCAPEAGDLSSVSRHLFFGLQGTEVQSHETFSLHGTTAMETRVRARLNDRPVDVDGVTFRRAGCLYDFMYVAPPAAFQQGRPDFEAFVQSWTPIEGP